MSISSHDQTKIKLILFWLITLLLLTTACSDEKAIEDIEVIRPEIEGTVEQIITPDVLSAADEYCLALGFTLGNGQDELCDSYPACYFPDGSDCRVEEFYKGRCGQDFTYCQQQGNEIQSWGADPRCNFPDGSYCPEGEFFSGACEPGQIFPE